MIGKRSGYSLIELLIVILIMGLLVGGSIAGYNTLNKRQVITNAGRELISVMRTAQARAISGTKPSVCSVNPGDRLLGYSVSGLAGGTSYKLNAVCLVGGVLQTTIVGNAYQLQSGVKISATFSTLFNVLTGGASGTIANISLVESASPQNLTYTLTVSGAGDITEQKLQ